MGDLSTERFQTGNHARVFVSGDGTRRLLGSGEIGPLTKGQQLNINSSLGTRPVHVIGDAEPQDLVDGPHTYTVRLSMLKLRTDDAAELINAGYVDIEVIDRFNNKVVGTAERCKLVDGNLSIGANNPVSRDLTFMAMRTK